MIIKTESQKIVTIDEAYNHLAKSIVIQAITDYREILNKGRISKLSITKYNRTEIEKFFLSDWCYALSQMEGADLIKIIQEQESNDATN